MTVRIGWLFIALGISLGIALGCSSPSPKKQLAPVQPKTAPIAPMFTPDAAVPPAAGTRGASCTAALLCADGLACAPLPGGYCASSCGAAGSTCDGTCVETARLGEICAKSCTRDADCRTDEGYACDPQWKACLVPFTAAIVPAACPASGPVRASAFGDSEPWSTAASPGVSQLGPSAVLTDDGGLVALYASRGVTRDSSMLAVSRGDGAGARTLDEPLSTPTANHVDPRLARDRSDTLYATWLNVDVPAIFFAMSRDRGATWSEPIQVQEEGACAEGAADCLGEPMIAIGIEPKTKRDVLYVAYATAEAGLRVRASHDGGTTFDNAVTALVGGRGNAVTTSDGRLHLVTIQGGPLGAYGSAHQKIEYTVSSDRGATFTPPVTVSGADELLPYFFSNPSIAVDVRRRLIYVAYVRGGRDARWEIVLAVSKDGGATWRRTKLPGAGCAIHMVPSLAIDPTKGTLHVAYYDNAGAPGRFVHASCGPGATKCMAHGAINSLPFATLSTGRYSRTWIGERATLLVDDKRRVLHAVWAQPVDETGKSVARIFHAAAKLPKR